MENHLFLSLVIYYSVTFDDILTTFPLCSLLLPLFFQVCNSCIFFSSLLRLNKNYVVIFLSISRLYLFFFLRLILINRWILKLKLRFKWQNDQWNILYMRIRASTHARVWKRIHEYTTNPLSYPRRSYVREKKSNKRPLHRCNNI